MDNKNLPIFTGLEEGGPKHEYHLKKKPLKIPAQMHHFYMISYAHRAAKVGQCATITEM